MSVSHGSVRTMVGMAGHAASDPSFQPVLQVINIKPVGAPGGNDCFRVVLSDGAHFVQGMLATQLNQAVHSQELKADSLIQVEDFMNNVVQGRSVIIVLKMKVLPNHPGQRIGAPTDVEKAGAAPSSSLLVECSTMNTMDPLIFRLTTPWLTAPDAFSTSCVCKEWRDYLSSNEAAELWKQICQHTHPTACAAFLAVENLGTTDFRKLTRSLGAALPKELDQRSDPSLTAKDVFAIVELYKTPDVEGKRRRVSLGSWSCPIEPPGFLLHTPKSERAVLRGANPEANVPEFTTILDPVEGLENYGNTTYLYELQHFGMCDALGTSSARSERVELRVKVTLFRRDNMKSVCVVDDAVMKRGAEDSELHIEHSAEEQDLFIFPHSFAPQQVLQLDSNERGKRASVMMRSEWGVGNPKVVTSAAKFTFGFGVPKTGGEDPDWLVTMRETGEMPQDRSVLANIPYFEFDLREVHFSVSSRGVQGNLFPGGLVRVGSGRPVSGDDYWRYYGLECANDFFTALEGCCWR